MEELPAPARICTAAARASADFGRMKMSDSRPREFWLGAAAASADFGRSAVEGSRRGRPRASPL